MKTYIHILLSMIFMNLSFGGDATIYFLAGEIDDPLDGETFVVPVSDPAQIATAREMLAAFKSNEEITLNTLSVEVTIGENNINFDYNQSPPTRHLWHVSGNSSFVTFFPGFAASPSGLNQHILNPETEGINSGYYFEGFTIIAELPFPYISANADGSKETWIGRINDFSIPWVYHYDFGWMFVPDTQQDGSWIWMNSAQKWVWTNEDDFPYLYSPADSGWKWYYHDPINDQDWFYDFTSESWSQNL